MGGALCFPPSPSVIFKDKSDSHETWHSDSALWEEQFDTKNIFCTCPHFFDDVILQTQSVNY